MSLLNYVPFVLTCLRALNNFVPKLVPDPSFYVSMCLDTFNYVPKCPLFLRAYVAFYLRLRADVLSVFTCLRAYVP